MTAPAATSPSFSPRRPNLSTRAESAAVSMSWSEASPYAVLLRAKGMRALPTIATRRRTSAMEPPPGKAAGRLCYAVTSARGSISHVAWRSQATSDCPCRDRRRRGHLQTEREQRREQQCRTDPRDTGCPAEALEKLAEDDAADDTAKEVAGKIDAARRSAVGRGRATDE